MKKKAQQSGDHANGNERNFDDLLHMGIFRGMAFLSVFISGALLVLSLIQFWYAIDIGWQDAKHNVLSVGADQQLRAGSAMKANATERGTNHTAGVAKIAAPFPDEETRTEAAMSEEKLGLKKTNAKQGLVFVIHGLEFLLLAPIPFFMARSLLMYITLKFVYRVENVAEAGSPLVASKAVMIGLLSSLVAVDAVSRILECKGSLDPSIWAMLAALVVLGAFYVALERVNERNEKQAAGLLGVHRDNTTITAIPASGANGNQQTQGVA